MQNLERQLNKETLHETDSNSDLCVIKVQFDQFIHSKVLEPSNYNLYDLETRQDFKHYTQMEPQNFNETIIQNMDSGEQCIVERARHEQELQNRLKRLNERKLQIQKCKIQENQNNISGDESSRSRNGCNDKSTSRDDTDIRPSNDTEPMVEADSNVTPDSPDMCDNDIQTDHNAVECDDERVALPNLIIEFERYKAFNDHTIDYDKLERKLNETLGLLAQKDIDIKEGLKVKAYEISIVKEKHDELFKQSLLTKSHYECLVKEKKKVITDLKLKEEKDIDKMISMENQLKFLNEIVYKRSQSIQTIHMLAPKCPTFNGRPTFDNPMYLKKAHYEKPCLYEIPHDQSDPINRLIPDRKEILTLEEESRSILNKDLVKPYNYTRNIKYSWHMQMK
ncbi:hypothetical protein Tco_1262543 [Tanacetum coccineum]